MHSKVCVTYKKLLSRFRAFTGKYFTLIRVKYYSVSRDRFGKQPISLMKNEINMKSLKDLYLVNNRSIIIRLMIGTKICFIVLVIRANVVVIATVTIYIIIKRF